MPIMTASQINGRGPSGHFQGISQQLPLQRSLSFRDLSARGVWCEAGAKPEGAGRGGMLSRTGEGCSVSVKAAVDVAVSG